METDMLVKLYDLPNPSEAYHRVEQAGVTLHRAMALDRGKILRFVRETFGEAWESECSVTLTAQPSTCMIAVHQKQVVGFACYDATAKAFFGPTGVLESFRGKGIGTALLYRTLEAMREAGYGYAIIGWVTDALEFYRKTCGAVPIPDSFPGVYRNTVNQN